MGHGEVQRRVRDVGHLIDPASAFAEGELPKQIRGEARRHFPVPRTCIDSGYVTVEHEKLMRALDLHQDECRLYGVITNPCGPICLPSSARFGLVTRFSSQQPGQACIRIWDGQQWPALVSHPTKVEWKDKVYLLGERDPREVTTRTEPVTKADLGVYLEEIHLDHVVMLITRKTHEACMASYLNQVRDPPSIGVAP